MPELPDVEVDNETNYCPRCQTGGKLLADRSLSRLLRQDWPRTIDEWEAMQRGVRPRAHKHRRTSNHRARRQVAGGK